MSRSVQSTAVDRPGEFFSRRRAAHLALGRRGERLARRLVRTLGLDLLVRNYQTTRGEIDIVARDGAILCFIEVKTRHRSRRSAYPGQAVGRAKRRALVRSAHRYLREIGRPPLVYRFDVIELVLEGRRVAAARYLAGAFTEEELSTAHRLPLPATDSAL